MFLFVDAARSACGFASCTCVGRSEGDARVFSTVIVSMERGGGGSELQESRSLINYELTCM